MHRGPNYLKLEKQIISSDTISQKLFIWTVIFYVFVIGYNLLVEKYPVPYCDTLNRFTWECF